YLVCKRFVHLAAMVGTRHECGILLSPEWLPRPDGPAARIDKSAIICPKPPDSREHCRRNGQAIGTTNTDNWQTQLERRLLRHILNRLFVASLEIIMKIDIRLSQKHREAIAKRQSHTLADTYTLYLK